LQYLSGQVTLEDFLRKFDLKTPFIPILYRSGIAVYSSSLGGNDTTTEYDLFAKLENWEF
jgi:hypothetical protein